MATLRYGFWIALSALFLVGVRSEIVNLCDDMSRLPIVQGTIHGGEKIYKTLYRMRTRVECATYCIDDQERCKMSVFHEDGRCQLMENYLSTTNATIDSPNDRSQIFILKNAKPTTSGCPEGGCSEGSVCLLDCSAVAGEVHAGCMKLTTEQYDKHGCSHYPKFQFKEYYLKNFDLDSSSDGQIYFTVMFDKMHDWTALRVYFRGSMRGGYGWAGGWLIWRVYFNNAECSNPGKVEGGNYNEESDVSHHKGSGLEGLCYDLPAGATTIQIRVYIGASSKGRLGWATQGSRFYVEELGQRGVSVNDYTSWHSPCPDLPSYNHRVWHNTGSYGNDYSHTSMGWYYSKNEDDTVLKINWDGVIRMATGGTGDSGVCAAWYIMFDSGSGGYHCSPKPYGRILANLNYASHVRNEHRSAEFEGYCTGIPKGKHYVYVRIERCPWHYNGSPVGDAYTGWNGIHQRLMVEEIKLGTDVVGVMGPDNQMYRIPQFNYEIFAWDKIDHGGDVEVVLTVTTTYVKKYEQSGLRMTFSGDGRCYYGHGSSDYDKCCRHYFTIDDQECTNPGTIEGIHYLGKNTNLHRPFMMDGICEGISAGTRTIKIMAGICHTRTKKGECYFGWNSYNHALVAETYVQREIQEF